MRITVDLTKASTEIVDLSSKLNPRVGDGGLTLPFHILYDDNVVDMHDKDIEFISQDPDGHDIYVSGTVDTSTPGDNAYQGDVTFKFPNGTFKKAGTYDTNKTMFRIVNKSDNSVISTVNVKLTVLDDGSTEFNFDPTKTGYNSRMEDMLNDFKEEHDKKIAIINQEGQQAADDAKAKAEATLDDVKDKAKQSLADITSQAQQGLDEIKQLSNEAKGNVAGDTATTAKQAKEQATMNAGLLHDHDEEISAARGRYMKLADRENAQDDEINRKEDRQNANENYAALNLRDDEQDKELAKKANQDFIINYLSRMHTQPIVVPDAASLQSSYPNGAAGIFVTSDDGHLRLWHQNQWQDYGVFQGKGIANRSVDNLAVKERTLALRTSQSTPWIVDLQNHKLTVSDYSFIYDDTFYRIPKGEYSLSDFGTVYLGYDAVKEKLNDYQYFGDIPESSYFIGIADFTTGQTFLQFDYVTAEAVPNGRFDFAAKVKRANLPAPATGLLSLQPWAVDTLGNSPTITVNGYSAYVVKGAFFEIKSGVYTLDKITSGSYYLYLDLDYSKSAAEIKATDSPQNIAPNDPWIGFIETNGHTYRIFDNSDNRYYDYRLLTPGKFTVDFDKLILYVPVIWQSVNPLGVSAQNDSVMGIKLDDKQGALYVGLDTSKSKANEMIVIDPDVYKIQKNYHYIGWISTYTREYDLGEYGSTHDLATQPWLNKKVACLGDSITEGANGEGGLIDSYVPKLKQYIGTDAQNFGKSGALITKKTDDDISFVNRVGAITGQDVVTIFGGINDFQWDAPLGTMADGADKPTTFYGALKYVITMLSANNSKAKLMLITPMKTTSFKYHTFDDSGNLIKNGTGNTQLNYVNAIKQVADYYSIPVLDMYSCSNYSPYLPSQVGHDNFTVDGLHPTAHGYERIAQTIGHAINNL